MHRITLSLAILSIATVLLAGGCVGDGCLNQLPQGFPQHYAVEDAVQVRLTESGLRAVGQNAETIIGALFPDGLDFQVPPSCDVDGPDICCDAPPGTCGVVVDMTRRAGDLPRLEIVSENGLMRSTMRMRVRSSPGPIMVEIGSSDCRLYMNSEEDDDPSITVSTEMGFAPDPLTGATRTSIASITVDGLDRGDIDIDGGGLLCGLADTFKGIALDIISEQISDRAAGMVQEQLCRRCQSDVQCGPHATCSGEGVCMINDGGDSRCLQDLGMAGRMAASVLHPALPSTSKLDVQLTGGGHTGNTANGFSLGLAAGVMPAASSGADDGFVFAPRLCGPDTPAPARPAADVPTMTQLNRLDEVGEFDVAFGMHKSFLDSAGWAAYQAGLLCITVDTGVVSVLNTDALSALYPSLADLLPDGTGQVAVRMRPQAPPTFSVGGLSTLQVHFSALDIDMFAMIDENFVRLFTAHTALSVPIEIQAGPDGDLAPVVGDIGQAFTRIEVDPSGMLQESPAEIAGKFPAMGSLVSQLLTELLGSIKLPTLAGVSLQLTPGGARSLDNGAFMGVFARVNNNPGAAASVSRFSLGIGKGAVSTLARITAVRQPPASAYAAGKLPETEQPVITVEVDGFAADSAHETPIEWQYRVNGGTWSLPTRSRSLSITKSEFWLPGRHRIEVRGRHQDFPETTDPTPVALTAEIVGPRHSRLGGAAERGELDEDSAVGAAAPATGGCRASPATGGPASTWLIALALFGLLSWRRRRRAGRAGRAALVAGLIVLSTAGCTASIGQDRQDQDAVIGRWSDIAATDSRVLISAYEQRYGDLLVGDVDSRGDIAFRPIDGVPAVPPATGPARERAAHRGGISDPGEDVGAATSIAIGAAGQGVVAYHDRTGKRLKLAVEAQGTWTNHVVDEFPGAEVGRYVSLAMDPRGLPGIAYMAHAVPTADGGMVSQLRWARPVIAAPAQASDWAVEVIAESPIAPPSATVTELPAGTGLYPSADFLPDGRAVVAFHDRFGGDLVLAVREPTGWVVTPLDAGPDSDTGHWASLAIDGAGIIHMVYQEAGAGHLRYCSVSNGVVSPVETIDDGDRETATHPVGAHAEIVVDGDGDLTVLYQDQYDVSVMVARRDPAGGWVRDYLDRSGDGGVRLRGGFFLAAGARGGTTWVSSFAYDRNFFPPGRLTITPLTR